MADKARQLRLSLQRWRESRLDGPRLVVSARPAVDAGQVDPVLVRVNIPQFELELWQGDRLLRTHRVVVGNNSYVVEWEPVEAGEGTALEGQPPQRKVRRRGRLNRTPLLSARIQTVVLNPKWHVPPRVQAAELEKLRQEHPERFARRGFQVKTLPDGTEQYVQLPGPGNALGRVKLLFPNPHAVYLHDTPDKKLFDRPIRAFSHGCMRLQDPVALATWILEHRDGRLSAAAVRDLLGARREVEIPLKRPVPIRVDYNTVTFPRAGSAAAGGGLDPEQPIFLHDVYGYDRAAWSGRVPIRTRRTLDPRRVRQVRREVRRRAKGLEPNGLACPPPSRL